MAKAKQAKHSAKPRRKSTKAKRSNKSSEKHSNKNGDKRVSAALARRHVMEGKRASTSGGLTKQDLKYNKWGQIVSKKASSAAKRVQNLPAHYLERGIDNLPPRHRR